MLDPSNSSTALSLHPFHTGHRFEFNEVSILDRKDHWMNRKISEMCHIKINNTVNKRSNTQNLNCGYNSVLRML